MSLTEREILDTPRALERTCRYFGERRERHRAFFAETARRKFVFLGCGSSYMLAKSAAAFFASLPETSAVAVPAGDYLLAPAFWQEPLREAVVVTFSRSGRTSEMVQAVRHIRATAGDPVVSICTAAEGESELAAFCAVEIALDWCYDESVCQTRTVTNFYAASLLLAAAYRGDERLEDEVRRACQGCGDFQQKYREALTALAAQPWDNAVVLADGPLCGIAEEGALAFTEISMLIGRYFHVLDYRHGPIVVSGERTLTVMALRPDEEKLQRAMAADVLAKGGPVVTVSAQAGNPWESTLALQIEGVREFAAWGVQFIYVCQMLALQKALVRGGNPDRPQGLDPYIVL